MEQITAREGQMCSGGMEPIPAGAVAYADADGWVWCAEHTPVRTVELTEPMSPADAVALLRRVADAS